MWIIVCYFCFWGLGIIIFIKVCQKHGRLHLCMQLRKLYVQFSKRIFPNKAWLNVAWEAIHSVTLLFSTDVISAESVDICSTNRAIRLCSALVKSMSCISSQYMKKQFAITFLVILVSAEPFQNDILCKHNGCMAYHCTITTALEFRTQFQERFWCLEKAFNWPAVPISTHNFCVIKWGIRAQKIETFQKAKQVFNLKNQ